MTKLPILCVDDEPRVLESLENHLSAEYEVSLANSGQEGLALLAQKPHAVVLSDMRMPGMNGATFLAEVRAKHPDTVRMLLTGHADLTEASEAVNRGNIFRLLLKPCDAPVMFEAVRAAYRQFDLAHIEKVLLEQTLYGAVSVLTDILSVVHPLAFGRATRAAALVKHALAQLALPDAWQVELAAMLSQLGCITFEAGLIEAAHAGSLTPEQNATFRTHPTTGRRLIERIPRLEHVAVIVGDQLECTTKHETETARIGCQLVRVALLVDQEQRTVRSFVAAVAKVLGRGTWDPAIAPALRSFHASAERRLARVAARELSAGMILETDVKSPRGELWMTKGTELTLVAAKRLRALGERGLIDEPVLVGTTG